MPAAAQFLNIAVWLAWPPEPALGPAQKAQAPAAGKRLLGPDPIAVTPVPVTRLAMIRRSRGSLLA